MTSRTGGGGQTFVTKCDEGGLGKCDVTSAKKMAIFINHYKLPSIMVFLLNTYQKYHIFHILYPWLKEGMKNKKILNPKSLITIEEVQIL